MNGDASVTNTSGQTTTTLNNAIVVGNVTVTNGANSYGSTGYNCHSNRCGATVDAGDMFSMTGTTIIANLTISNATDGNSADIESSVVLGAVSISNVVKSTNQSNFCCNNSCNIANAADEFTLDQSFLGSTHTIANISDGIPPPPLPTPSVSGQRHHQQRRRHPAARATPPAAARIPTASPATSLP